VLIKNHKSGIIKTSDALVNFLTYKNKDLNNDKTAWLNENLWSAHGGVTQKYYSQRNGKSLEFMEVLIGIVSGTERQ